MSLLNDKLRHGLVTGEYLCEECGSLMIFEDEELRDILICPKCGYSVDIDDYGFKDDPEAAERRYPTEEEVLGIYEEESDCEETYEDVYGETEED